MLATGGNGTVHLYDAATWTRVGSIPAEGTVPEETAFLHPDGRSLVANNHYGVVEWTLEPETLAEEACALAGRNLTRAEWATYFADEAYRRPARSSRSAPEGQSVAFAGRVARRRTDAGVVPGRRWCERPERLPLAPRPRPAG